MATRYDLIAELTMLEHDEAAVPVASRARSLARALLDAAGVLEQPDTEDKFLKGPGARRGVPSNGPRKVEARSLIADVIAAAIGLAKETSQRDYLIESCKHSGAILRRTAKGYKAEEAAVHSTAAMQAEIVEARFRALVPNMAWNKARRAAVAQLIAACALNRGGKGKIVTLSIDAAAKRVLASFGWAAEPDSVRRNRTRASKR